MHLKISALLLLTFGMASIAVAQETRPNIVFIRTDDQARWAVGFNGNDDIHTPNMDRLHREGASFTNAFVTTPVCSPSRLALMTGIHGIQGGVTDWIQRPDRERGIDPDYITWPEALQSAGYVTGLAGKWHLGNLPQHHPLNNGFAHFVGTVEGGTPPLNPVFEVNGTKRELKGEFAADFLTDDALHFIRQNRHVPFLLAVDFREPHTPYAPMPEQDRAHYAGLEPRLPHGSEKLDQEKLKRNLLDYYAAISCVDRNVGRILDVLDDLQLAQNTIVVFTSDHGYMIGHHGLWHKGNATTFPGAPPDFNQAEWKDPARRRPNMFDDSIRVPLAIRWPARIKPGTVVDGMVLHIDLHPTLLSLAGVETPKLPAKQKIQGRDFSPLLRGERSKWRDHWFGDYDMLQGKHARMRMIRTTDWKLVKHYEEENAEHELYDLKNDPGETKNVFKNPPDRRVLEDLEERLREWQIEVDDPLLANTER